MLLVEHLFHIRVPAHDTSLAVLDPKFLADVPFAPRFYDRIRISALLEVLRNSRQRYQGIREQGLSEVSR